MMLTTTGACGTTNVESDYVAAIGHGLYESAQTSSNPNENPYCGKQISATLPETGKTVTVTVVDKCAACDNNSLDFSGGAWDDITNGAAPARYYDLSWSFL